MQFIIVPYCAWICLVLAIFILVVGLGYAEDINRVGLWILMNLLLIIGIMLSLICCHGINQNLMNIIFVLFIFLLVLQILWISDRDRESLKYVVTASLIFSIALIYITLRIQVYVISLIFLVYFILWIFILSS